MEKYKKGLVTELPTPMPFDPKYTTDTPVMRIKPGTKLINIRSFVQRHLEKPESRHVIITGMGTACLKAVSCVEVFKRNFKICPLYQLNQIRFVRVVEHWDPVEPDLERLQVNRDIPAIFVLLTKDHLDEKLPGYQHPDGLAESVSKAPLIKPSETKQNGKRPRSSRVNRWKRPDKTSRSADEAKLKSTGKSDKNTKDPTATTS